MARPDLLIRPCLHLLGPELPAPWPFGVAMLLDQQLGLTDALVRCGSCNQMYLMELVAWPEQDPNVRTFRCAMVDDASWARFHHDSQRAYCDLERMQAELHALITGARLTPWLLEADVTAQTMLTWRRAEEIPTRSWRDAAFD